MEDLIARIAADAGVEPGIAEKAVGMILAFLRKEGPKDEVDALFAALPGAAEAADAAASEDGVRRDGRRSHGPCRPAYGSWPWHGRDADHRARRSSPMCARKPATSVSVRSSRRSPVSGSFFERAEPRVSFVQMTGKDLASDRASRNLRTLRRVRSTKFIVRGRGIFWKKTVEVVSNQQGRALTGSAGRAVRSSWSRSGKAACRTCEQAKPAPGFMKRPGKTCQDGRFDT